MSVFIGASNENGAKDFFDGDIAAFVLWDSVFLAQEIASVTARMAAL